MNISKKKKLMFVIPNLCGGGAERIMSQLLFYFTDIYNVVLVCFNKNHVYPIPNNIIEFYLDDCISYPIPAILKRLHRISRLRKLIKSERPDVILSFLTNLQLLLATRLFSKINSKIIIAEHNTLSYTLKYSRYSLVKKYLLKILYKKADKIITVSEGVKSDLIKTIKYDRFIDKIDIIYNPHNLDLIKERSMEKPNHPWLIDKIEPILINIGSLTYQKGQDILLEAFKLINEEIPSKLIILGQGPLLNELQNLATKLCIRDRVDFAGFQKNPFSYISHSDVFVLSSRWEGFPNVLIEALACGVPVVSTDCPSGPNEVLVNGENGLIVPVENPGELASALIKILEDKSLAKKLSENGKKSVEKYSSLNIFKKYKYIVES